MFDDDDDCDGMRIDFCFCYNRILMIMAVGLYYNDEDNISDVFFSSPLLFISTQNGYYARIVSRIIRWYNEVLRPFGDSPLDVDSGSHKMMKSDGSECR